MENQSFRFLTNLESFLKNVVFKIFFFLFFDLKKIGNSLKSQIVECPCCLRGVHGLKDTHSMVHLDGDVAGGPHSSYTFAEFAEIAYPEDGSYTVTSASSLPFTPSTLNSPLSPTLTVQFPSDEGDLHKPSNSIENRHHSSTDMKATVI